MQLLLIYDYSFLLVYTLCIPCGYLVYTLCIPCVYLVDTLCNVYTLFMILDNASVIYRTVWHLEAFFFI